MSREREANSHVALVIGNRAYKPARIVKNAVEDAVAMAEALKALGYERTDPVIDTPWNALDGAILDFQTASAGAEVALFYYAGHSVELDGINYLLPVDAEIQSRRSLKHHGIVLDEVLKGLQAKTSVILFDACRNDPFEGEGLTKEAAGARVVDVTAGGSSDVEAPKSKNVGVFFAAPIGKTALDFYPADTGPSRHSPFAQALLDHLATPGMSFKDLIDAVTTAVKAMTRDEQVPWFNSSFPEHILIAAQAPAQPHIRPARPRSPRAASKAAINFSLPKGARFRWTAEKLGSHMKRIVTLRGFTPAEEDAPLRVQTLACQDAVSALQDLGALAATVEIGKYRVIEDGNKIVLQRETTE